ncbi:MAG: restriction endonuclease subunit S [Rhodospirillaceae bacterium]
MKWREYCLGEVIEIKHGYAFKSQYFSNEGEYILLTPGNCYEEGGLKLKGEKEKYFIGDIPEGFILNEGDLLVVMTDLVQTAPILGGSFFIPEGDKFLHNQRLGLVHIIKPKVVNKKFLYYTLNTGSYRGQVRGSATGATVRHTAPERIYACKVELPSYKEQMRITKILSSYDKLIENNRRRIALLEEAARQLYKEWFVRFRFPGHEHVKIIDGIPEGWGYKRLIDIADLTMGQSPKSEFYNTDEEGLPFHQGVTNFGERFVSHGTYCTKPTRLSEPGDILFSVRAPVGRLNITIDKIILGRGLAAIRSKKDRQSFLFYQLKSHFFKEDMIGGGAIYASVTKSDLENQEILVPTNLLIEEFDEFSSNVDKQIKTIHLANKRLIEARDILLPKLMSGEIAV